jgi:hypothetical protein
MNRGSENLELSLDMVRNFSKIDLAALGKLHIESTRPQTGNKCMFIDTYTAREEWPAILREIDSFADPKQPRLERKRVHTAEARFEGFIRQCTAEAEIADCDAKLTDSWILGEFSWLPYWPRQKETIPLSEISSNFLISPRRDFRHVNTQSPKPSARAFTLIRT